MSSVICCFSVAHVLWLNGRLYGSAMVPLDKVMVTTYRLSVVIMFLSAAV